MRTPSFLLAGLVLTILVCVSATAAAIEPLGPFSGKFSEGFETQQDSFVTELPVFAGEATVRNLFDGPYLHISGCWTGIGVVCARSGICFMGSVGGGVEWIFDVPAGRFGGYFTVLDLLPNTEGAVAYFYDVNDNLLAQMDVNAPYSTWIWNGWLSDVPIKRVEIIGLGSSGWLNLGGFVMHDDMEYTPFGEPGTIHYVDDDATGANDGSCWEDAFVYLQDALAAAQYGDEILVAQGIYKPDQGAGVTTGDREATFQLINGVTIKGGYAGLGEPDPNARDIAFYETILSGDLDGNDVDVNDPADLLDDPTRAENSYHVVTGSGTDETAVLYGFNITAGNANGSSLDNRKGGAMYNQSGSPTVLNCAFIRNNASWYGGGIANVECNPTVTNCTFIWNSAGSGGGIYNWDSSPTLDTCSMSKNSATHGCGGGMFSDTYRSRPTLSNCTISGNSAKELGGGIYHCGRIRNCTFNGNSGWYGGALVLSLDDEGPVSDCIFSLNSAERTGGGVWTDGSPTLVNCTFNQNSATEGGGVSVEPDDYGCHPLLVNCTFTGNSAMNGGGVCNDGQWGPCKSTLNNCTFSGNSAVKCGGGISDLLSHSTLDNCILWGDKPQEIYVEESTPVIRYSDVQGGWPGEGNIDIEPLFVNASGGDYHLRTGSPCIDAGDPDYIAEPNDTDLDGKPRVIAGRIDMGAYEYYAAAIQGELKMLPRTLNRRSEDGVVLAVMQLPVSDVKDGIAADEPLVLLPGDIKAVEQKIMPTGVGGYSYIRIRAVFDKAELLEAIPDNGEVQVTIIGRLVSGQQFYGIDTIRIINSRK